jgi:hypothetical protein
MLTFGAMMDVIKHERAYGGLRRHRFGQLSLPPRRHNEPVQSDVRVVMNEREEVRTYNIRRDRYEWVKLIRFR